jgi:hypothetical protein
MPAEPNKRKTWELVAVFALGGAAGFYLTRMFQQRQESPEQLGNQHWHSNKLQITAPGYAPSDTSDATAMGELLQPEPELY